MLAGPDLPTPLALDVDISEGKSQLDYLAVFSPSLDMVYTGDNPGISFNAHSQTRKLKQFVDGLVGLNQLDAVRLCLERTIAAHDIGHVAGQVLFEPRQVARLEGFIPIVFNLQQRLLIGQFLRILGHGID